MPKPAIGMPAKSRPGVKPAPQTIRDLKEGFVTEAKDGVWASKEEARPLEWLHPSAKENFLAFKKLLHPLGMDREVFSAIICVLAESLTERNRLRAIAFANPPVTPGKDGSLRKSGAYVLYQEADKRFSALLTEFGLTPSSASRVTPTDSKSPDDPFAEFDTVQ